MKDITLKERQNDEIKNTDDKMKFFSLFFTFAIAFSLDERFKGGSEKFCINWKRACN